MLTYEMANKIVAHIPDECRSAFWRIFDEAQSGDADSYRAFQIFVALYNRN